MRPGQAGDQGEAGGVAGAGTAPGRPRLFAACAAGWSALAALLTVRLAGLALDDFFITYRYAANLAAGRGFAYNPGERVFGLTEPGLGLLLAALHRLLGAPIPWLGTALSGASLVAIALVLLAAGSRRPPRQEQAAACLPSASARAAVTAEARAGANPDAGAREPREPGRRDRPTVPRRSLLAHGTPEAWLGGTLAVGSSLLWVNQGGAGLPALCALLLAAVVVGKHPPAAEVAAGLLAAAAVWLRPDSLAGACLLAALLAWERRRVPWRYAAACGAAVLLGVALAWVTFGTPWPNTLAAKHAMAAAEPGSWSGFARFWPRVLPLLPRHWGPAWAAVALCGIAGLVPLFRHGGRPGRLLVLFAAVLAVAYPLLGVPFFSWYAVPATLAVLYGIAFLGGAAGRWVARLAVREVPAASSALRPPSRLPAGPAARARLAGAAAAALVLLPLLASLVPASWRWLQHYQWQPHLQTYREAALWLRGHSAPEEAVAYVEIGVLGYDSERPIHDLLGLVTPAALPYVAAGDLPGAFLASPAPWVAFHTRGRMRPLVEQEWFRRAYRERARFTEAGGGAWMVLYHRRPGSALPPPRPPQAPRPLQLSQPSQPGRPASAADAAAAQALR